MKNQEIIIKAIINAGAAMIYVSLVALLLWNAENIFGQRMDGFLAPMSFLMLFVLSAAVMGLLIFGKPVMLYIDGKKRVAVRMLAWTVGFFAVATIVLLAAQVTWSQLGS